MRYGFEGLAAINLTGSPTAPVWTPLNDVCDDVSIEDDGDEVEAGTRRHGGVKQTARARLSRGATLSLPVPTVKSAGNPLTAATAYAALLGASRKRVAVCDLAFFDQWTLDVHDVDRMAAFWSQALGYRIERGDRGDAHLRPPAGGAGLGVAGALAPGVAGDTGGVTGADGETGAVGGEGGRSTANWPMTAPAPDRTPASPKPNANFRRMAHLRACVAAGTGRVVGAGDIPAARGRCQRKSAGITEGLWSGHSVTGS